MKTYFDAFLVTEVGAEAVHGDVYLQMTQQQNALVSKLSQEWI